jgi:hypothetical protein
VAYVYCSVGSDSVRVYRLRWAKVGDNGGKKGETSVNDGDDDDDCVGQNECKATKKKPGTGLL